MPGRPNKGSWAGQRPADPNWKRRDAKPFAPEVGVPNLVSVKHGADSDLILNEDAAREIDRLREEHGALWLERFDANVLYLFVRAMARFRRLDDAIEQEPNVMAIPKHIWEQVSRESREVRDNAAKLAFTASDRAALMKDGAMARALNGRAGPVIGEQGRALRQARGRGPDDAGGD